MTTQGRRRIGMYLEPWATGYGHIDHDHPGQTVAATIAAGIAGR